MLRVRDRQVAHVLSKSLAEIFGVGRERAAFVPVRA